MTNRLFMAVAVLCWPLSAGAVPLVWQPCPDVPSVECAQLTVPLDHQNPAAGDITLPVVRAKVTTPAQRIGTLVFNPGGPGVSAVDWIKYSGAFLFSATVRSRFDIVGVDPRGVSDGLTCLGDQALEQYWTTNHLARTAAQAAQVLQLEKAYNQACTAKYSPLIQHVDTASAPRDIELLRVALNEPTITYVGFSYGTYIGELYAQLYPSRVRAMVLDSVVDRTLSERQIFLEQAIANDFAFREFELWCHKTATCELRGKPIEQVLKTLLARARTNPIPAPKSPNPRPVNDWELTIAIQALSQAGVQGYLWVEEFISAGALRNDASLARLVYDSATGRRPDGTYYPGGATHRAIFCVDEDWSRTLLTPVGVLGFVSVAKTVAPLFGEAGVWQSPAQCFGHPPVPVMDPPVPLFVTPPSPILLVAGTRDASTPMKWAVHIATRIQNSRLLIREGNGHINYDRSTCVQSAVDAYLTDLTLPAFGTVCHTDLRNQPEEPPPL